MPVVQTPPYFAARCRKSWLTGEGAGSVMVPCLTMQSPCYALSRSVHVAWGPGRHAARSHDFVHDLSQSRLGVEAQRDGPGSAGHWRGTARAPVQAVTPSRGARPSTRSPPSRLPLPFPPFFLPRRLDMQNTRFQTGSKRSAATAAASAQIFLARAPPTCTASLFLSLNGPIVWTSDLLVAVRMRRISKHFFNRCRLPTCYSPQWHL